MLACAPLEQQDVVLDVDFLEYAVPDEAIEATFEFEICWDLLPYCYECGIVGCNREFVVIAILIYGTDGVGESV